MAFKATNMAPDEAYESLKEVVRSIRTITTNAIASLAGTVNSGQIIGFAYRLKAKRESLAAILANTDTTELIAYAKAQEADLVYDVVAEYNTMSTNVDAVVSWVQTNFPTSGGFLLAQSFGTDSTTDRTFNTAATADLLTAITTLHNSIE